MGSRSTFVGWLSGADLDDGYRAMLTEELAIDGDARAPRPIDARAWPAAALSGPSGGGDRRGVVGDTGRTPAAAGGRRLRGARQERRCGRDLAGELLSRLPGWTCSTTSTATRARSGPTGPSTTPASRCLRDYFADCATRWGIRDRIRFGAKVESLAWGRRRQALDDPPPPRQPRRRGHPSPETTTAGAVVSAVGQLNRPLIPDSRRRPRTSQASGSTARAWRHDIDWSDKRVAAIGTGRQRAAVHPVAGRARRAAHPCSSAPPPWLIPRPLYHEPLAAGLLRLFELVPQYHHWFRLRLFWCTHEGTVGMLRRDPDWDGPLEQAVSPPATTRPAACSPCT